MRNAVEGAVGHELSKDYAYDLLHWHKWRKIMPPLIILKKMQRGRKLFTKLRESFGVRQKEIVRNGKLGIKSSSS